MVLAVSPPQCHQRLRRRSNRVLEYPLLARCATDQEHPHDICAGAVQFELINR
jgi:hypothetical protein